LVERGKLRAHPKHPVVLHRSPNTHRIWRRARLRLVGRVLAKTYTPDLHIESYPLVFPNETTEEMSDRWEREVVPRLAKTEETENRLVIAVPQDPIPMAGSSARARLHLANILDRAKQHNIMPFVVGPTPIQDLEINQHLAQLNAAYKDVAE